MVTAGRQARVTATDAAPASDRDPGQEEARTLARERIRRAMAGGDYDGLLDPALWRLLDLAAATSGFGREIGALRFAMARLLAEEEDPRQLATYLAKVTTMIVRATQAQRQSISTADDPIRAALLSAVDERDELNEQEDLDEAPDGGAGEDGDGEEDGW